MADLNIGDVTARLRVDATEWVRGLQAAQQQLQQFNQQLQGQATSAATNLQTSLRQLTQAQQQSTQATQQFTQQLSQMGQQLQQTAQQAQRAGSAWQTMLQIAGGIGLATSIQGIVSSLVSFSTETVRVGARMEQLRASLSALAGSTAAGQQQFDGLFQMAQRLGVPFENLARGFRTLTAAATQAGLPLSDQRRLLEAVATEGRRVGASNEELNRAFTALGQMASKGVVSMEELRQQLGEALPTALAAMARGMGTTTEELTKLVEAGGVRFPTAARALTRGLEEIQATGLKAGDTLTTAWNKFGNELLRSRDLITQSLGPLKAATEAATSFLKILNDSAQAQQQLREARAGEALIGTGLRQGDVNRLPAEQQRRLTQLNRLIAEQVMQQGDPNAPPMFQPSREEFIKQLQDERAAIYANAQAIKGQTDEQMKATAEINKGRREREQEADAIADIQKRLEDIRRSRETFGREAALAPQLYGRQAGTVEEQQTYLKEQQQRLRPMLEGLTTTLAKLPAGITLPPEVLDRVKALNVEFGQSDKLLDRLKDKQQALRREATQGEQAPAQVAGLEASLGRLTTFLGRPGTTLAAQARATVEQQGVELQSMVEKALETIRRNPAIARLAPQLKEQFEAGLAGLGAAVAAQADRAFETIQARTRQQASQLEATLERIQTLSGRAERSAPEQARVQVLQQGAAAEVQLRQAIEEVSQSLDLQQMAPNLRAQLEDALATLPEGIQRQAQQAFERTDAAMRLQIAGMGDQLDQIAMKLDAAGLSPLQAALAQIRREFEAMLAALDRLRDRLGEEFLRATPERQEEIKALVDRLDATRQRMPQARDTALREREQQPEREYLERLQQELDQRRAESLGPETLIDDPRLELRLRQMRESKEGQELQLTPEGQSLAQEREDQIRAQRRLNYEAKLFEEVANSVGSAWSNALMSIADGTATVSEAFKAMARSILQSMAQIASQEATKAFIRLGLGLLTGSLTSGLTSTSGSQGAAGATNTGFVGSTLGASPEFSGLFSGASGAGGFGGGGFGGFQHGGIVTRPQLAMVGENPAMNPEYILNQPQMARLMASTMRAGPSAGGQAAGGVSIHNYPSKEQAQEGASRDRAMGRQVILNEVLSEIAQGEGSRIVRSLRTIQR